MNKEDGGENRQKIGKKFKVMWLRRVCVCVCVFKRERDGVNSKRNRQTNEKFKGSKLRVGPDGQNDQDIGKERIRKIVIKTRQDFGSLEVAKKDCKKTFRIDKKEKTQPRKK